MSVEISGPKGYEVQYLITVWIALLAEQAAPTDANVLVEHKEDAELAIPVSGTVWRIALQSKHQTGKLDLEELGTWLSHFAPRSDEESLLQRILSDEQQVALFVTQARCADEARGFCRSPGDWALHETDPVTTKQANRLADILSETKGSYPSMLEQRRASATAESAKALRTHLGRHSLRKILVWEQITEAVVKREISQLLQQFRIPHSEHDAITRSLLDVVINARKRREEIMPAVRKILRSHAADRILREMIHTPRSEDQPLTAELEEKHILWLTGRSLSGKTHAAQSIAQSLQDVGIECLETDDLRKARTFLAPSELNTRIALLDDPLLLAPQPLRMWEAIAKFAQALPPQHRLIVTAKIEQLKGLDLSFDSAHPDVFGFRWHDLTVVRDREFLIAYWTSLTSTNDFPPDSAALVVHYLRTCDSLELLQPGQLRHLAYAPAGRLAGQSIHELIRVARFNAHVLARELLLEQSSRLLCLALGIGATSKGGINERELGFLLSQVEAGPALAQEDEGGRYIRLGNFKNDEPISTPAFPAYDVEPQLTEEATCLLRSFEQRGFLFWRSGRIYFAHPDYREAFQERVMIEPSNGFADIITLCARAFGALDPAVGTSASLLLNRWIAGMSKSDVSASEPAVELAFRALRTSIFPDVRAAVMLSLLNNLGRLRQTDEQELLRIALWSDGEAQSVTWSGETAWLNDDPGRNWVEEHLRTRRSLSDKEVESVLERLTDPRNTAGVTGPEADAVNTAYLRTDRKPDPKALAALLNRDEVFIRSDAAYTLIFRRIFDDAKLYQRVFEDQHPIVLARAVRAVFESWPISPGSVEADLRAQVCMVLREPAVAAISSRWLFDLGDKHSDYHSVPWEALSPADEKNLWRFWVDAMDVALRTLAPRQFWMKSGDLYLSAKAAAQSISPEDACRLADAWLTWIVEQTKFSTLDDYAVSVAAFLLESTASDPKLREQITCKLLSLHETDAIAQNLIDLVSAWDSLTNVEQDAIAKLLESDRDDVVWLQALVLTRSQPPRRLVELIIGRSDFFKLSPKEQSHVLTPPLLAKCLQLLTGPVGNGSQFGVDDGAEHVWRQLLNLQFSEANEPHFLMAVSDLIRRAALHAAEQPELVSDWQRVCISGDQQTRSILFTQLINWTLNYTYSRLAPFWETLLELQMEDDEREGYFSVIAEYIEGLSCSYEDATSLFGLLGDDVFVKAILPRSIGDAVLCSFIAGTPEPPHAKDVAVELVALIATIFRERPPRILFVVGRIRVWLQNCDDDVARALDADVVEATRLAIIKKGYDQKNARRPFRATVHDWFVQGVDA
ncbi:MAG TPA: hypothetical protein VGW39_12370 [Chthoniobacterales bacterium]|nr:hypothetical protein [Chthoniobacterales bacterium]